MPEIGGRIVRFHYEGVFEELLDRLGEMPLPPYIHEKLADQSRYQTVYAKMKGLPLRRRRGCTSRRSCSNASAPRV